MFSRKTLPLPARPLPWSVYEMRHSDRLPPYSLQIRDALGNVLLIPPSRDQLAMNMEALVALAHDTVAAVNGDLRKMLPALPWTSVAKRKHPKAPAYSVDVVDNGGRTLFVSAHYGYSGAPLDDRDRLAIAVVITAAANRMLSSTPADTPELARAA